MILQAVTQMIERRLIEVEGLVQGVGFRPFVHELATRLELRGSVRNDATGVSIDVEGDPPALDEFLRELNAAPPPLAVIERVRQALAPPAARGDFRIQPSDEARTPGDGALVSPDVATCDACVRELLDPRDRRYRYAFLSCAQCGPRLTIGLGGPYDRHRTAMGTFPMCAACRREYEDPRDRRFHAQTIACGACGPTLVLHGGDRDRAAAGDAALRRAVAALLDGAIVAVKGLGGYHLACDATNPDAVRRLRERKRREAKPLAVMLRDAAEVERLCEPSGEELALLRSPQRPIVLVAKRPGGDIAAEVAPGHRRLGVMLPYAPLHHLLLADADCPLVMTSGNATDEPIAYRDADALARLAGIADLVLRHDREIVTRCDDSVVRVIGGAPTFVRRSRGYAPRPIALTRPAPAVILGVGGHLKNTFCLVKGRFAFPSHHIGDLENADAHRALEEGIAHYESLFDARPEVVAHDLHPDYLSTALAERLVASDRGIARVGVQHHHAHIASCVAEHGVDGPVIGVAFDGTGLGTDGAIWGGEVLLVEGARFDRVAHLSYVPLPGGDAAVRHPWRSAVAHLWSAYGGDLSHAPRAFIDRIDPAQLALVVQLLSRPALAPPTSSVGRLFDAVAALLGVRRTSRYEAQAAMELETLAEGGRGDAYAVDLAEQGAGWTIDSGSLIRGVVNGLAVRRPVAELAAAFHAALCDAAAEVVRRAARRTGVRHIALSGGAFQNAVLTEGLTIRLARHGFDVLRHRLVPCNDGGLALGQAHVGALRASGRSPCA